MSERIWKDRCEDCYNEARLTEYTGELLPEEVTAELCAVCIEERRKILATGKSLPKIGLLLPGIWLDLPIIEVLVHGQNIKVHAKRLTGGEFVGTVRIRFDGQKKWMAGGVFGTSNLRATYEAQHFLRQYYFPGMPVSFP